MDYAHHDLNFPDVHLRIQQSIRDFIKQSIKRTLSSFGAVIFMLLAVFLSLSLYSYASTDISLNTVPTFTQTQNWMKQPGAYSADMLIQLWGHASYIWVILALFWSIRIWHSASVFPHIRKIFFGLCTVTSCATFITMSIASHDLPTGSGGVMGAFLTSMAQTGIWELDIAQWVLSLFLSLIFLHLATGQSWLLFKHVLKFLCSPFSLCYQLFAMLFLRKVSANPHPQTATQPQNAVFESAYHPQPAFGESVSDESVSDESVSGESAFGESDFIQDADDDFSADDDVLNVQNLLGEPPNSYEPLALGFMQGDAPDVNPFDDETRGDEDFSRQHISYENSSYEHKSYQQESTPDNDMPDFSYLEDDDSDRDDFSTLDDEDDEMMQAPMMQMPDTNLQELPATSGSAKHSGTLPMLHLLETSESAGDTISDAQIQYHGKKLEEVLRSFKIEGNIHGARSGPIITLYEFEPAPGIKTSRIVALAEDVARALSANSVRIAPVSGKSVIGIELPNPEASMVGLREILQSRVFQQHMGLLPIILGKDIGGKEIVADLAKMPHLLVAGTTGSGKSVGINAMILSLLYRYSPEQCRMIMIDPKMLELSVYNDIPHLLSPVVTEPKRAIAALKWAVREMERRYQLMASCNTRNIVNYNQKMTDRSDAENLPYIVIVIDEMADLMLVAGKEIEILLQRLAQMARAAGIHLITATQRPSVDVITGTIKANFPTRISYQVTSKFDSRTILGEQGAENLLGRGDMLFMPSGGKMQRLHGPFTSDTEVERVCEFLREQGAPDYVGGLTEENAQGDVVDSLIGGGNQDDDLYNQAVDLVVREKKASTSFVQRHLQIGYNRAARLIEQMEKEQIISPANHVGRRDVLIVE